ncbi:hypothetical protein B0H17DRAFT_1151577 [Mycena rosella]|uniref:Uncharacterized protein n=1 Tax=Mycena rosella TaxID=1033263 RepID=A0AAD7BJ75_MYCRO|nr:hypothetical protein B0H17DRAFT_1151577 [Mycena rosella]
MPPRLAAPKTKTATGPPQALVARIQHLGDLLRHLPTSLADYPSHSLYNLALDPERLKDGGYFSAVGHALEISFQTHLLQIQNRPLLFIERGRRHDDLVKLLKMGVKQMSPSERTSFQEAWIEWLITAAVDSGAKIPSKKRKAPVDDIAVPPAKRQQSLSAFSWAKATPESTGLYWAKAKQDGAELRGQLLETRKKKAETQHEREKDLARLRKQRQRERDKARKDDEEPAGRDANTVLMEGAEAVTHSTDISDIAALSRANTQGWKKNRNGTLGSVVRGSTTKVFWFTPFLWAIIEPTIRRCGWSAARTVNELHCAHPNLFNGPNHKLHRATVWKWIVPGEQRFTDAALRSISARSSLGGSGRTGVLTWYPEIV